MGYSGARGTLIFEKNLKSKISSQTPFNPSASLRPVPPSTISLKPLPNSDIQCPPLFHFLALPVSCFVPPIHPYHIPLTSMSSAVPQSLQIVRLSVQSSELAPHPPPASECCPPFGAKVGSKRETQSLTRGRCGGTQFRRRDRHSGTMQNIIPLRALQIATPYAPQLVSNA